MNATLVSELTAGEYRCTSATAAQPLPLITCSVSENVTVGSFQVQCTPTLASALPPVAVAAAALSASTSDGIASPFTVQPYADGAFALATIALLDFNSRRQYQLSLSLCFPLSVTAIPGWQLPILYSACVAELHVTRTTDITVNIIEVNKPPAFSQSSVTFQFPIASSSNATVGVRLQAYASDPNTKPPWNVLTFTVSQLSVPTGGAVFAINPATGQLVYSLPAARWFNATTLNVTATDGDGLLATVQVTILYTESSVQLSVAPQSLHITHYAPGVSVSTVAVQFSAGSVFGTYWSVKLSTPPPQWLSANTSTADTLSLVVDTSAYGDVDLTATANLTASLTVFVVAPGVFAVICTANMLFLPV